MSYNEHADLNDLIGTFDADVKDDAVEKGGLTMWIPADLKDFYDKRQRMTKRQFGEYLKAVVIKAIEIERKKVSGF